MKIKLAVAFLLILGCITCSKDSFNTTPTLKFENINGTLFPRGSTVTFNLQCTDKEGDVVDTIWIRRFSKITACQASVVYFDSLKIPNFNPPKNVTADFQFSFNYAGDPPSLQGCSEHDDTVYFKLWMKDQAHHTSDTVTTPDIVLLQQ